MRYINNACALPYELSMIRGSVGIFFFLSLYLVLKVLISHLQLPQVEANVLFPHCPQGLLLCQETFLSASFLLDSLSWSSFSLCQKSPISSQFLLYFQSWNQDNGTKCEYFTTATIPSLRNAFLKHNKCIRSLCSTCHFLCSFCQRILGDLWDIFNSEEGIKDRKESQVAAINPLIFHHIVLFWLRLACKCQIPHRGS